MEVFDNQFSQAPHSEQGLQVTRNMRLNWLTTSKWAIFFSVLGFIYVALMFIVSFALMPMLQTIMSMSGQDAMARLIDSAGVWIMLLFLLAVAVIFLISLFHLRFASNIQRAMQYDSQQAFESAWRNLRNYFRINGIFTIVSIVLYIIGTIAAGSILSGMGMGTDF
ncbi:MAG: hypothetical protein KF734_02700 [Saprospiraceae bacterium]|nr:hypothetical protein [Saprospiraceae bacterium]